MPRSVLLVAFHFPPVQGSSGVQRTLRFAQHLPTFGWRPIVLTIRPEAYEAIRPVTGNEVPESLEVHRAFGFDAARQLSVAGRYPRSLAMPDRWATWKFWAVRKALKLIRGQAIDAVWSTFPTATAQLIGLEVARRSGVPWVAEFRDPMWQGGEYPPDPRVNVFWKVLEGRIFQTASRVVVTAPGAADTYSDRFPRYPRDSIVLIPNGFDEETFRRAAESLPDLPQSRHAGPLTLLHSGIIYRSERDPTHLFKAIASLKGRGELGAQRLQLILRASGDDAGFRRDVERIGISDIVRVEPAVDYLHALKEMLTADGLLLLQASNCNAQVPAKLYEYLRAGRPIVALTDPAGDTARTLSSAGTGIQARLDSTGEIERALLRFLVEAPSGTWRRPPPETIRSFSRESQSGQLAHLLDELVDGGRQKQ